MSGTFDPVAASSQVEPALLLSGTPIADIETLNTPISEINNSLSVLREIVSRAWASDDPDIKVLQDVITIVSGVKYNVDNLMISSIRGLADVLDNRADLNHTHSMADIDELSVALANKADDDHGHSISDVTGLSSSLTGKSDTGHGHVISDTSGLGSALSEIYGRMPAVTATFNGANTSVADAEFEFKTGYLVGFLDRKLTVSLSSDKYLFALHTRASASGSWSVAPAAEYENYALFINRSSSADAAELIATTIRTSSGFEVIFEIDGGSNYATDFSFQLAPAS